jgi:hypothetical protein
MPSSASCRDAHAVMPRPRGIQDRTASDAVVLDPEGAALIKLARSVGCLCRACGRARELCRFRSNRCLCFHAHLTRRRSRRGVPWCQSTATSKTTSNSSHQRLKLTRRASQLWSTAPNASSILGLRNNRGLGPGNCNIVGEGWVTYGDGRTREVPADATKKKV